MRPSSSGEQGYTLIEILLAMSIVAILGGAAAMMARDGVSYSLRFRRLFSTQTELTRALHEISYGYAGRQGAAGADQVEVLKGPPAVLRISDEQGSTDYSLEGAVLTRARGESRSIVVTDVQRFAIEIEDGVLTLELERKPIAPGVAGARVVQRVFLRNS